MRATSAPRREIAESPRMRAPIAPRPEVAEPPRMRAPSAPRREVAEATLSPWMEDTSATRREVAEATVSPRMEEDTSATREAAAALQRKTRARRIALREEDEEASAPPKKKKATSTSSVAVAANAGECFPPGPERYGADLWTEVTKHLSGYDLVRLSCTCSWLHNLMVDDSIWRYAFYRDLDLLNNDPISGYTFLQDLHISTIKPIPHRYWHLLYVAVIGGSQAFLHKDSELNERCVSGFIVEGDLLVTASFPVPKLPLVRADTLQHGIELSGACLLTNACRGVWIVEMQIVDCTGCSIARCDGSKQVLDVRHCDMLLENIGLKWDSFENEEVGCYSVEKDIPSAFCAIINSLRMDSDSTVGLLKIKSWIGEGDDHKTKTKTCPYAVAVNTNLNCTRGLLSVIETVRDLSNESQLVWIRMTQSRTGF